MKPTEFADIVEWCEARWPGTLNYTAFEEVAQDFVDLPKAAVQEAAENHYNAGNSFAPTLAQLRSEGSRIARRHAAGEPPPDRHCEDGQHGPTFAITDLPDGTREAECLNCGHITIREASQIPTVGETRSQPDSEILA